MWVRASGFTFKAHWARGVCGPAPLSIPSVPRLVGIGFLRLLLHASAGCG
jgi:hypothetical protein